MKIYISADMEGISGIPNRAFITEEGLDYQRGRHLMTADINAAVEGLLQAGADEIVVNDSHGLMTNVLIEELNPAAELISGNLKLGCMMAEMDDSFDAVVLIGYHAMASSEGLMAHTISSKCLTKVVINGNAVGEAALSASVAGYYGKPVIAISGDNFLEREITSFLPWVEFAKVKTALSNRAARCLPLEKSHALITKKTAAGLKNLSAKRICRFEDPVKVELTLATPAMTDITCNLLGVERISGTAIAYSAPDILKASNMIDGVVSIASSVA